MSEKPEHEYDSDYDTKGAQRSAEMIRGRLEHLAADNLKRSNRLSKSGITLNSDLLVSMRIEHLIDHLMLPHTLERLKFEVAWQERLAEVISRAEKQSAKKRLLRP